MVKVMKMVTSQNNYFFKSIDIFLVKYSHIENNAMTFWSL